MSVIGFIRVVKLKKTFGIIMRWDAFWICENHLLTSVESIYKDLMTLSLFKQQIVHSIVGYQIKQIETRKFRSFLYCSTTNGGTKNVACK